MRRSHDASHVCGVGSRRRVVGSSGVAVRICAWVLCVLALVAPRGAAAADGDLAEFEDPAATPDVLRDRLDMAAAGIATWSTSSRVGDVAWCSRDEAAERALRAGEVKAVISRTAAALRGLGWNLPTAEPPLTVVRVRVSGAPSLVLPSSDGRVVLVRYGDAARVVEPPTPPARSDGAVLERDVVAAANRARVWAKTSATGGPQASVAEVAARRVVRWALPSQGVPPWMVEGFTAWAAAAAAEAPAAPGHVCKGWAAPTGVAAVVALDAKLDPPAAARPFLGRLVAALVEGRTDVPQRVVDYIGKPSPADAAVTRAFGRPFAEVLAKANASAPPATAGNRCDDAGTIACPACAGAGRFDVACPDCSGSGGVTCPSCLGSDGCPNCDDGFLYYSGGRKVKCRFCTGGKSKCVACGGSLRTACKSCSGSGKVPRACLACRAGRLPCPDAGGGGEEPRCAWCADSKVVASCRECGGAAYQGCKECFGTARVLCGKCEGTGEVRMVYEDGTTASQSKCGACNGKGWWKCDACQSGRMKCDACRATGRGERDVVGCVACGGTGSLPQADPSILRTTGEADADTSLPADGKRMLDSAVAFLLGCRDGDGPFALRKLRRGKTDVVGALEEPTVFSNAMALWTLSVAGRGATDAGLKGAWAELRKQANEIAEGTAEYVGAQGASLTLRALIGGGEPPDSPLVKKLIDRIVKGQRASGFWGGSLADANDPDNPLDTLFAAEGLRAARVKGARVPSLVWQRLYRAACSLLDTKTLSPKNDFLIGTDVASGVALVVMAREGMLGSKATTFDYASMPQVKKGMAWLDRHFSIETEPQFSRGARSRSPSDAGYMAWLFSIQRLGMLLRTEELGGQRWYSAAIRHLKSIQYTDGSFEERSRFALNGPLRTTCGAILFLLRATPPITDTSDE